MRIANPIYDTAFKYLMEDQEIARRLLGKIIGEEIVEVMVRPQEMTSKSKKHHILIFRLDFKAIIKTKEGHYKNVLIELQKAKVYDDLIRFRRYLGENYKRKDEITDDSGQKKAVNLPITTIYFLGFPLPHINTSVLNINRVYKDLINNEILEIKTEFVEQLTHDSFIIIIPELPPKERTELEGILKVFNQSYKLSSDNRLLEISEQELGDNELTQLIAKRLRSAATDEKVLQQMEVEEEVETMIDKHIRKNEELQVQLQSKDEELQSKDEELQSKDEELQSKEEELQSKEELLKEQKRIIEELKRKLEDD